MRSEHSRGTDSTRARSPATSGRWRV